MNKLSTKYSYQLNEDLNELMDFILDTGFEDNIDPSDLQACEE